MSYLTIGEQKNVRTALRLLRFRVGSWEALAKALRLNPDTLEKVTNGRRAVTPNVTFRVATFAEIGIDDLMAGRYAPAGTCPHCGHPPDFSDEQTVADGAA